MATVTPLVINAGQIERIQSSDTIDATKISTGIISNTEFDYLDGVTSAIQTQLGTKKTGGSAHLLADTTTSNTTITDTNLLFAAAASTSYNVRIWGHASKATTASGMKLGIAAPTGATITGTQSLGQGTYSTAWQNNEITAINTLGSTFATGIGVKTSFVIQFTITTGVTSGNVKLAFATITSNVATIYAGTNMEWIVSTGL